MKTSFYRLIVFFSFSVLVTSCYQAEDPGPLQDYERDFSIVDFDRLDMGDAFHITVRQGNLFEVKASGDRRNIDDLIVRKEGSTLLIRYDENRNRRHTTYIDITMPTLHAAYFSGATDSRVSGFDDIENLTINLSGASTSQFDVYAANLDVLLSGASQLYLYGEGEVMDAEVSGASYLRAFSFPTNTSRLNVSGASKVNVTAANELNVVATGASHVSYRGTPQVESEVSGASAVEPD